METLLPPEIETEILLRLPSKSLQRFTSVCKSWHSLISSCFFIHSYHSRTFLNPQLFLLKHPLSDPLLPSSLTTIHFSLSSDSLVDLSSFKVPQEPTSHSEFLRPTGVELVTSNSINGIVCVLVYMGVHTEIVINCDLFLWNPSTSESVKIPSSEITGLFSGPPMVKFYCGFGTGLYCEDYKVVRIVYPHSDHAIVEVYSLRENCWRRLDLISRSGILSNILWASLSCTFVDGVGHWGAFRRERKDKFFVLGFDFGTECFKKIKVPVECVDGREMRYHSLWVYKGSLAISVLRFGEFESKITRHYIWVMMNENNWFKLFNIDLVGGPRRPIATLGNGELLLLGYGDDGEHALYDPELEEVKWVMVDISDVNAAVSYVESLVSLSQLMPK